MSAATIEPLTREEYSACQLLLLQLVRKLEELPLDRMVASIERAHAVGPMLDPTLYRRGVDNLQEIGRLAGALLRAQRECQAPMAELRQWAAASVAELAE